MHSANAAFSSRSSNMSQGCPVPVGNSVCGETNSLEIMKEFNRLYEERMDQVDCEAGGDYLQEKLKLQQEWIKNLTQQNEMLVRAVQELEYEATERVQQLEDKLQKSAQCLCEGEKMLIEKERTVEELTQKLNHYSSYGDVEGMARELQIRRQETESLKQELADVRQVLTEEVASKHDQIVQLKKDILVFEERCLQADKQTAFKEDIVKELRKEIKQLKQQVQIPEKLSQNHSLPDPISPNPKCETTKPYIIVNHSSKKQAGKNTVIYINKDGTVHRKVNYTGTTTGQNSSALVVADHTDNCLKCKNKLNSIKSVFPSCKSENDLIGVKNMLKPVKPRSKLTSSTFTRSKTFVDQTTRILNEIEFEELYPRGKVHKSSNYIPVRTHIDNLEKKHCL